MDLLIGGKKDEVLDVNAMLQEPQITQDHLVVGTKDLSKHYGKIVALDRATLTIAPGCTAAASARRILRS